MKAAEFFTTDQRKTLEDAIRAAELNTSGEIRLHLEMKCEEDVLDHAAYIFEELEMHKTQLRNGVLFYLAIDDRKLAILGDAGINAAVPHGFWDEVRDLMVEHFKKGEFTEGLSKGIQKAGEQLKHFFPYKDGDKNELSDDISFGESK